MKTRDDIAQEADELADRIACLGGEEAPKAYELRDALLDLTKLVRSLAKVPTSVRRRK